ncbi:CDP-alcohol phosphatidyltransferase family protein [Thioalkalivibrio paradoxus]|uniref:CDP-diacylglycerol--glycerol-3-phosphate 3-phosphatidyltransferase n=1 Tax=Thioalkalivibrio paradoxus ARh 1 TaxID=713585 RepID=W0DKG6_9GAMM|nr:CDP-alcohol phosphatidyltransferase family protein [Thioalkalivibrio paradoxus]AHE97380.1 CDP-alcohol phosphatidyltransferase [Thioalkalivibrio paradoxus ARh 1]
MRLHHIPNAVTASRIVLTVPIVWFMYRGDYWPALALLSVAGLTDALDGYLVRRYGWKTALGAWLDPAADKILMLGVYLAVTLSGLLPLWLLFLVVGRDLWLTLGSLAYRRWVGPLQIEPLMISKVNTFFQILLVLGAILKVGILDLDPLWVQTLIVVVSLTTVLSGLAYTAIWGWRAWVHFFPSADAGRGA